MKLNAFTDYSLRVLIYLGVQHGVGRAATIPELARAYGVSRHHLRAVIHRLAQLGYVRTTQGRGGVCALARAPGAISVGEVVRRTEADFDLVECFRPDGRCPIAPVCTLRGMLTEARASFLATLDRYTVTDMIPRRAALARRLAIAG
jgi:Rrf2 family nitric oxide-sensitive transcriptional repressor